MTQPNPEPVDPFDRLITNRTDIAEFVNSFESPKVQREAFKAIVCSLGLGGAPAPAQPPAIGLHVVPEPEVEVDQQREAEDDGGGDGATTGTVGTTGTTEAAKPKRARKSSAKKTYSRVKDINFRPEGKVSLRDFWTQKSPANNHEKNLVIVHYLEEFLEVGAIEVGHVLAGYDEVGVKSPAIPDNSLMVTASQKGWLDTGDMKAIRTTHGGRNAIQYDMPTKKDKTPA